MEQRIVNLLFSIILLIFLSSLTLTESKKLAKVHISQDQKKEDYSEEAIVSLNGPIDLPQELDGMGGQNPLDPILGALAPISGNLRGLPIVGSLPIYGPPPPPGPAPPPPKTG